ncbi:hypothetical protein GCM10009745_59690 [Kribbella yunnanensis]|uniref:Tetratricopeptide repeat protein n=1 Tax=Kribbella yunnanensis TaxID=190194 RepID=A0ABP4UES0_9ACTN
MQTSTASWYPAGELPVARGLFGDEAAVLKDGRVMVVGGADGRRTALDDAAIYDPDTNQWSATGGLVTARRSHTTTVLPSGKVLVVGGETGALTFPFDGLATAELWDPASESWTETGSLRDARWGHTATLLPNGTVLVAGGAGARTSQSYRSLASAEIFDPETEKWTPTVDMVDQRTSHSAVQLADGRVLVIGGFLATERGDGVTLSFCELYDVRTGRWTPTGSLAVPRGSHTATVLADGSVLVTGGWPPKVPIDWNFQEYSLWSAERFEPATGLWSPDTNLPAGRAQHRAVRLKSGEVLLTGGTEAANVVTGYPSTLLYDARLRTWTQVAAMSTGRFGFGLLALADGRALAIGGVESSGSALPVPGNDAMLVTAETFGAYQEPQPPTQDELDTWLRLGEEWSRMAAVHHTEKREADAVAAEQKAAVFFLRLRRAKPPTYTWRWAHSAVFLGVYLSYAGQHDKAADSVIAAIEACREVGDRPREAWAAGNLAAIRDRAGRPAAAVEAQRQARTIYADLATGDPTYRGTLARAEVFLGVYLARAAQYDEAVAVTRHAIGLYQALGDRDLTAWANTNLASHCAAANRYQDAVVAQTEARRIYRELAATDPKYRPILASTNVVLGGLLIHIPQYDEAIAATQEGIDIYRSAADRPQLAWALGNLRTVAQAATRLPEAIAAAQESRDIYAELTVANPAYRPLTADAAYRLGGVLKAAGQRPAALSAAREAVALYEQLTATDPTYSGHLTAARNLVTELGG